VMGWPNHHILVMELAHHQERAAYRMGFTATALIVMALSSEVGEVVEGPGVRLGACAQDSPVVTVLGG
jgi:hypothetical protein